VLRVSASVFVLLLCTSPNSALGQESYPEWLARMSLPRWVNGAIGHLVVEGPYALELGLNPFFQAGDFDNDRRRDAAVFVRDRASGKRGILLVRRSNPVPVKLGLGQTFGNGGDDFRWLNIWRVEPTAKGDQLVVEKSESASGAITWDGRKYRWTQLSD
jgi:hypothetical protein